MISDAKSEEFRALFADFVERYLSTPEGQNHFASYAKSGIKGSENLATIRMAADRGEGVTDDVLRGLLPHTNSAAHRASGAWIHIAPAIQGDVKEWFEGARWTKREDWPHVAKAILTFVARCNDNPDSLAQACADFMASDYTRGLQTGLMSPIFNAVHPDRFLIVNNKSWRVINYFTGNTFKQPLTYYPETNQAGIALIDEMKGAMCRLTDFDHRATDLFDQFSHWLVAVKKYSPITGSLTKKVRTEDREVLVSVPDDEIEEEAAQEQAAESGTAPRQSYRIQAALAQIGIRMGFRIWVPRSDRQNVLALVPESQRIAFIDELPLNYDDITLQTIERIDVIWLRKRSIARAFEVEHTTAVYSGILRMSDLLAYQPNMDIKLYIVAPDDRRDKVKQEIRRPTFSLLERGPLYQLCSFIPYTAVEALSRLPHLKHMTSGSIVDDYSEQFAEDEED